MWYRYRGGGPTTRDGVMILFDELNPRRGPCRIRKAGTEVHVWTVNTEADLDLCVELGVAAVITDTPGTMLKYLNA